MKTCDTMRDKLLKVRTGEAGDATPHREIDVRWIIIHTSVVCVDVMLVDLRLEGSVDSDPWCGPVVST